MNKNVTLLLVRQSNHSGPIDFNTSLASCYHRDPLLLDQCVRRQEPSLTRGIIEGEIWCRNRSSSFACVQYLEAPQPQRRSPGPPSHGSTHDSDVTPRYDPVVRLQDVSAPPIPSSNNSSNDMGIEDILWAHLCNGWIVVWADAVPPAGCTTPGCPTRST